MRINAIFSWVFMLSACALLAIGRIYDERLVIWNINLAILIGIGFLISVFFMLFSIKKTVLSKTKFLFYLFYLMVLVMSPLLWLLFDVTEFGLEKFFNFWFIVVPISVVIIEKYKRIDVLNIFYILLGVCCFLALLSIVGLSVSARADERMAALGGGPIVFARWMGFGILTLFFLPVKFRSWYKYFIMTIFLTLALASGSRGPILALIITGLVYLVFNFNRLIVKVIFGVALLSLIILISGIDNKISQVGNFDRIFLNVSKKGFVKHSTSTRKNLAIGSFILLQNYPLGVGAGNWQTVANKIRPTHLMPLEYPHNLFLEVACEYGLHSLIILIILFLYVFYLSYNKMQRYIKDKTSLYPLLFYLLLFLFFNSMVSGMLNDSRLLFIVVSFIIIHKPLIDSENVNYL